MVASISSFFSSPAQILWPFFFHSDSQSHFAEKRRQKQTLNVVVLSPSVSRVDPRECPEARGDGGEVRLSVDPRSLQEPPRRFRGYRTRTRRRRPPRPSDPCQLAAVNLLAFTDKQQSFLGQSRSQLHRSRWRPIRLGLAALSLNALHSGPVLAVACFARSFSFAFRFVIAIGMWICFCISCWICNVCLERDFLINYVHCCYLLAQTLGIGHAFSSFIWLCGPITGLVVCYTLL